MKKCFLKYQKSFSGGGEDSLESTGKTGEKITLHNIEGGGEKIYLLNKIYIPKNCTGNVAKFRVTVQSTNWWI